MEPQAPAGQDRGVQQAFSWQTSSSLGQHDPSQQALPPQSAASQHPLQAPSQQLGVWPEQWVSSQHAWQLPPHRCGLLAGQAHTPSWQVAPPQHAPAIPLPHARPKSRQVGQQAVPLLQPLLLMLPFGIVVRQKTAPLVFVLRLILAPRRSASTRHALPRLAPPKLAPLASACFRLAPERLQLVQLTFFSAVVLPKSHFARYALGLGVQEAVALEKQTASDAVWSALRRGVLPLRPLPRVFPRPRPFPAPLPRRRFPLPAVSGGARRERSDPASRAASAPRRDTA
jgi:hypothetical protein